MQEATVHIAALWEESAHLLRSSSCWCRGSRYWNILTWFTAVLYTNIINNFSIISINIIIIIITSSSSSTVVQRYLVWKTLLFCSHIRWIELFSHFHFTSSTINTAWESKHCYYVTLRKFFLVKVIIPTKAYIQILFFTAMWWGYFKNSYHNLPKPFWPVKNTMELTDGNTFSTWGGKGSILVVLSVQ
jgi:hypothetical protein